MKTRELFSSCHFLALASPSSAPALPAKPRTRRRAPPAPDVTTAAVLIADLRQWADFTGRLEAVESVEVKARVGGYLEAVHFEEGGRVAQGDLLLSIDPRPFQAEVDRLNAERKRAEATRALARSNHARAERLLAQNATSREEVETFAAEAAVAEAQLAAVRAALDAAELNLSFTRVTAPISRPRLARGRHGRQPRRQLDAC